jgi:uracil phosphoribosyltransferase
MVDGIHNIIPTAKIGHIGLYRDEETLQPQVYYSKVSKRSIKDSVVLGC